MIFTDKEKIDFLEALVKEYYTQGDSYSAYKNKKGNWQFGYSNDYEMQHGSGGNFMLPDGMVQILMEKQKQVLPLCDVVKSLPCSDEIWLKAQETDRFLFEEWFDGLK